MVKKGELTSRQIVLISITLITMVILIAIAVQFKWILTGEVSKQTCIASVTLRDTIGKFSIIGKFINLPFSCAKEEKVEIKKIGKKPEEIRLNVIKQILDAELDCWQMMGSGKKNPFSLEAGDIKNKVFCYPCKRIYFGKEIKEYYNSHPEELKSLTLFYLDYVTFSKKPEGSDKTYAELINAKSAIMDNIKDMPNEEMDIDGQNRIVLSKIFSKEFQELKKRIDRTISLEDDWIIIYIHLVNPDSKFLSATAGAIGMAPVSIESALIIGGAVAGIVGLPAAIIVGTGVALVGIGAGAFKGVELDEKLYRFFSSDKRTKEEIRLGQAGVYLVNIPKNMPITPRIFDICNEFKGS